LVIGRSQNIPSALISVCQKLFDQPIEHRGGFIPLMLDGNAKDA
jgi:hypothetical protein